MRAIESKLTMETLPKIKTTAVDFIVEISGWLLFVALWVITFYSYSRMPEIIPTHYNGSGVVDDYGSKSTFLSLPIVGSVLFIGMYFLMNFIRTVKPSESFSIEYGLKLLTKAKRMLRYLTVSVVLVFTLLVFQTYRVATEQIADLGTWFTPFALGLIFIPMLYFMGSILFTKAE